ncbi:hypothetical protein LPICM17_500037 [Lactococcus piscium]|nr:hypothetical protein LPICM17_500037 [Lactococcus piscium]
MMRDLSHRFDTAGKVCEISDSEGESAAPANKGKNDSHKIDIFFMSVLQLLNRNI